MVAAPELGKKLAGLEEDAGRGGGGGAVTGGRRHSGAGVADVLFRGQKNLCATG